jgi:L-rhamnose mutarotase
MRKEAAGIINKSGETMKTYAYTIDLKDNPEIIAKYKEYHRNIWPELIEANKKMGVKENKIFLLGTRLFMIMKVADDFDPQRDMQNYAAGEREKEWDALMRSFQKPVPEAGEDEWWAQMECVFDLDWHR